MTIIIENTIHWLFEHSGPVIRYRLALLFDEAGSMGDPDTLERDLLQSDVVKKWLDNLQSYEFMTEQRSLGQGLGESGHSSFLHGSKNMNFEVVIPKLAQLGLTAGMTVLDEKTLSWRNYLKGQLKLTYSTEYLDDAEFHQKVYAHHDRRLIIAGPLALAGYIDDESVRRVVLDRLDVIFETVKTGTYDIYENPDEVRVRPAKWKNHIVKRELYPDGNIRLPFIHDISGFACLYPTVNGEIRKKIDTIIGWLLTPEYQSLGYYAYIRYPSGRGKHVGDNMTFPGYPGCPVQEFERKSMVLRCWQMAHFPTAVQHTWFQESMKHLDSFATGKGTWIFPSEYLTEMTDGGKWSYGLHMGFGENRRSKQWREVESTFWMLMIRKLVEDIDNTLR